MNPPPVPADCPQCRRALPPGAPLGMCPSCLMDAAGTESEIPVTADPFAAPLDLETLRRVFPQLEILAPLGAGGMGRVYKVRQPHLDRIVALKVVPPEFARDPAWVERFTREARALARLNHPNIVQVYDFGQTGDTPPLCWLLMEYVDGVTLRQVQRTGGLSSREALTLIPKLCDALQYAHEKGVLHRDIKPENILLDAGGGVKIADFGLAKLGGPNPSPTLTLTGARLGTAAYMAPEQIESPQDVDHRADIYSLGVVLYELLTGGLPLGRFPAPSEKSGTDPRLDHIVFRTLEKERDRRYQAAGDVRTALDHVAAQPPPPAAPVKPEPRVQKTTRPLTPGEPPPLPKGAVAKVTYSDRGKSFPGSSAEAWGGCGALMVFPFQLALAVAPGFIPLATREFLRDWQWGRNLLKTHPEMWIGVAILTGFAAVLAARPLMASLWLPLKSGVKRAAPWLSAAAIVIWVAALLAVAGLARSWPSRGEAAQMLLTFTRPVQTGGSPLSSDRELDALLAGKLATLKNEPCVTLMDSGDPATTMRQAWLAGYSGRAESPLMKRWQVVAAGSSRESVRNWLIRTGAELSGALPESVRDTAEFHILSYGPEAGQIWPLRLQSDECLGFMGLLMTMGGCLTALCRARSAFYYAPTWLLAGCGLALYVKPPAFLPGIIWVPAVEFPQDDPFLNGGIRRLAPQAENGGNEHLAAIEDYINGCLRLDRAMVEKMMRHTLDNNRWENLVTLWRSHYLLRVQESAGGNGQKRMRLYLFPKPIIAGRSLPGDMTPAGESQVLEGKWLEMKLSHEGENWFVEP